MPRFLFILGGILMGVGNYAILIISAIVGVIIGVTAFLQTAPTVSSLASTSAGTALANAGVTSSTLAGTVYSFYPVVWALGGFAVVAGVLFLGKGKM